MPNTHITKNYFAHGGNELVIGGKLTILPEAVVEGGEGLSDRAGGTGAKVPYIADSEATTVAALKSDFNVLLAALRTAGLMEESSPADDTEDTTQETSGTEDNGGSGNGSEGGGA